MKTKFKIAERWIGPGEPAYMIAELSANHLGDFDLARRTLDAIKETGADAAKVQTYTPETLTIDCDLPHFQVKGGMWDGRTLYDLYAEASMPWAWQPELMEHAKDLGLTLFSTPFDDSAVEFLESLGAPAYKIASFEMIDHGLVAKVAATGRPTIMSTGMATAGEIDEAVRAFVEAGGTELALLKCTSAYPADPRDANLRTIPHLANAYRIPTGLSDHTMGSAVAVAAVTLGAVIVEKHFTLSREAGGLDGAFSMEPQEFKRMVEDIRLAEAALGEVQMAPTSRERESIIFRRSLIAVKDIDEGERFSHDNIRSIRPGYGLSPKHLPRVLGARAVRRIPRGTPIGWDHLCDREDA